VTLPADLIGVLDLMDGHVVRAVGGRRDDYRPIKSRLCSSSAPLEVARAFRGAYGIEQLYVADLDAIRGGRPHAKDIAALAESGFRVTLDAGFRTTADLGPVSDLGVECFVASVESLSHANELLRFVEQIGAKRLRFSIDLVGGVPMAEPERWRRTQWGSSAPLELATLAAEAGIDQLIVLDLRSVGTGAGSATSSACQAIKASLPKASIWTGGGLRTFDDALDLTRVGVDGVLVASALHDGTFQ